MKKNIVVVLILGLAGLFSCNNNKLEIDVSHINLEIKSKRFEQEFFNIKSDSIAQLFELSKKNSRFFQLYTQNVLNLGSITEVDFLNKYEAFKNDVNTQEALREIATQHTDFQQVNKEIKQAFKHYKYYFPEKEIPEIYTCFSAFNYSVFTDKNLIGIGLDMYLGSQSEFYARFGFEQYKRAKMYKERIPTDCMQAWAYMEFPYHDSINNLLSQMVYEGKILYFLDAMLPETADSIKLGFKKRQLDWCKKNEAHVWSYLIEKKQLFNTNRLQISRYIDDGPFTANLSRQSPAKTVSWIGLQIVRAYMENKDNISLTELMYQSDYQLILNESRYKP